MSMKITMICYEEYKAQPLFVLNSEEGITDCTDMFLTELRKRKFPDGFLIVYAFFVSLNGVSYHTERRVTWDSSENLTAKEANKSFTFKTINDLVEKVLYEESKAREEAENDTAVLSNSLDKMISVYIKSKNPTLGKIKFPISKDVEIPYVNVRYEVSDGKFLRGGNACIVGEFLFEKAESIVETETHVTMRFEKKIY